MQHTLHGMTDATAITLQRLSRNDNHLESAQLELEARSDLDVSAYVSALEANTKVRKIAVQFYRLYTSSSDLFGSNSSSSSVQATKAPVPNHQPLVKLFETIGALPKLEQFSCSIGMNIKQIPVSALVALMQEASQLQVLQLSRLELKGTTLDFQHFEQAIRRHTALQTFALEDCKMVHEYATCTTNEVQSTINPPPSPTTTDQLLRALASLSSIQSIKVTAKELFALGVLLPVTLKELSISPTLQTLTLKGFRIMSLHLFAMAPGIAAGTSRHLKELILPKCDLVMDDCLASMIAKNNTLEHFEMPISVRNIYQDGKRRVVNVASKILQTNTKLKVLNLGSGLPELGLRLPELDSEHTSERPNSSSTTAEDIDRMRFHLKLNQAGRGQLLSQENNSSPFPSSCHKDWVHAIGKVSDDLDCIHYFMSLNPSLYAKAALLSL